MKTALVYITCCTATASLLMAGVTARAEEPAARFVAEYGPHAEALRTFYTGREARYRSVAPARSSTSWQQETIYKVRYDHNHYLYTNEGSTFTGGKPGDAPKQTAPSISVRNRQYVFTLKVKSPNEYAIRKATIFADGSVDPNDETLCLLCFPYADPFLRLTYLEMVADSEHTVVDFSDTKWRDGRPVKELKVRREFRRPGSQEKVSYISSHFFDPANGWVCVGNRVQGENGSVSGEVFEYESAGESLPAIKHWESWTKEGNGPEIRWLYNDMLEFRRAPDLSEKEFRLSAFGLPEPMGVRWEKPTPRYIWFVLGSAAFGVLAVVFRYLARRRAARAVV